MHRARGIIAGLDLSSSNTFVQQYVDKPLIIDKKKFDIGIYTIITSMEPLTIYIIDHEILLRYFWAILAFLLTTSLFYFLNHFLAILGI